MHLARGIQVRVSQQVDDGPIDQDPWLWIEQLVNGAHPGDAEGSAAFFHAVSETRVPPVCKWGAGNKKAGVLVDAGPWSLRT